MSYVGAYRVNNWQMLHTEIECILLNCLAVYWSLGNYSGNNTIHYTQSKLNRFLLKILAVALLSYSCSLLQRRCHFYMSRNLLSIKKYLYRRAVLSSNERYGSLGKLIRNALKTLFVTTWSKCFKYFGHTLLHLWYLHITYNKGVVLMFYIAQSAQ